MPNPSKPSRVAAPTRREVSAGVWLDADAALFLEDHEALVVADIHWGVARSHRAAGNLLPQWGDEEIAARLDRLRETYAAKRLVLLGDSVHHVGSGRKPAETYLDSLRRQLQVDVLAGNHDRNWNRITGETLALPPFFLTHGDVPWPLPPDCTTQIQGHLHPAVRFTDGAGLRLKLRALVCSPTRLILPAFSPWAAGVDYRRQLVPNEELWGIWEGGVVAGLHTNSRSFLMYTRT